MTRDAEVLGDAVEQVAGHPQLVADLERGERADLELPLAHHHLGVGAGDVEAGLACRPWCGPRRCRDRRSRRRRRRSSTDPAEPGKPPWGQPSGRPSLKNVYSCSMPNNGSWSAYFSATAAQAARVLVGCGVKSVSSTSHSTRMSSPPRIGSGHDEDRLQHAVGVVARRLVGGRTVEAPDARLLAVGDDLGLRPHQRRRLGAVDPDVLSPVANWVSYSDGDLESSAASTRTGAASDSDATPAAIRTSRTTVRRRTSSECHVESLSAGHFPSVASYVNAHVNAGRRARTSDLVPTVPECRHGTPAGLRVAHGRGARGPPHPPLVHRRARASSSRSPSRRPSSRTPSRRACTSTARPSTASAGCRRATCWPCPTPTPSSSCRGAAARTCRPACSATSSTSTAPRSRATPARCSSATSTRPTSQGLLVHGRPRDGVLLLRAAAIPSKPLEPLDTGSYFDLTTADVASDLRKRTLQVLEAMGIPVEYSFHEDAPSQHEIDLRYTDALIDGRQRHDLPARRARDRPRERRLRHLHAQAAGRRAGLGHAHPRVAVRGRHQRLPRPGRRVRPVQGRPGLHRRPAAPRARDHRGHQPAGQLLQAAHRRLRGAHLRHVGPQQPLGARAHPGHQDGQAVLDPHRVPGARSGLQPVPRVLGHPRRRASRASKRATSSPAEASANLFEHDARGAQRRGHRPAAPVAVRRPRRDGDVPSSSPRRSASTSSSGSCATSGPSGSTTRARSPSSSSTATCRTSDPGRRLL